MPISSTLVTRFFQLLAIRKFAKAERELERIKQRLHETEWNKGYFAALIGMLLAMRDNNSSSYTFFSKLGFDDKADIQSYRREFLHHVKNKLHGDFDRGFFSAWADCTRVLSRRDTNVKSTVSEREKVNTSKDDKNQATIENFIKKKA